MSVLRDIKYEYDLAGNITKKTYSTGTTYTYKYSIGYQLTQVTDGTTTWTFDYDSNGNLTQRSFTFGRPATVDFQATYDEYNRMKGYRFGSAGAYNQIQYDAIGRVWKRTDTSSNVNYYYHTSRALAQELDDEYNVVTDYLARSRRYMPGEAEGDKYRYYHRDHLGSVALMTGHDLASNEEYTYDAWGEHVLLMGTVLLSPREIRPSPPLNSPPAPHAPYVPSLRRSRRCSARGCPRCRHLNQSGTQNSTHHSHH